MLDKPLSPTRPLDSDVVQQGDIIVVYVMNDFFPA
jgi:hypothetical protein